ncbi:MULTISPECIES: lamin tail domain-containing protein [unclassified Streptomyces]|uniref:lamin tail domain-containing protein n=1 Tax=unclassified Streptomyces TaxID=2593676 RepID=UPI001F5B17BB|nr:lamin tail domain-containing protein [Streptomyces sp. HSG2]
MSRTHRVASLMTTALLTGAMVSAAAVPASAGEYRGRRDRHSAVAISEIQYNAPGRDRWNNRSVNREYFTVKNTSRRSVQMRNYTVTDRRGHTYRFRGLRLRGGQEVVVHSGFGRDNRRHVYQDSRRHLYDNRRGALVLRDKRGHRVDRCSWNRWDRGHTYC